MMVRALIKEKACLHLLKGNTIQRNLKCKCITEDHTFTKNLKLVSLNSVRFRYSPAALVVLLAIAVRIVMAEPNFKTLIIKISSLTHPAL